jgi:hypothetical protein
VSVRVAWQTNGCTPLYIASRNSHDEVVRALVGAGAAVNQARVCEHWSGCWCSGVRGWLDVGSQHACAALCACVCSCLLGVHGDREMRRSCSASSRAEVVDVEQDAFMCVIACERGVWAIIVLCVCVCVVWQTDGLTPLYAASHNGHVEVVRALVGAGAAVNQARVREDMSGCWCSGVRGWLDVGSQHARAALCACVCARVCWVCMAIERCDAHVALRVVPRPLI